jgi:hypothetical protein
MYTAVTAQWVSDLLRSGRSGDRNVVGGDLFRAVRTGPEVHLAFCTTGTGSFPGAKRPERGADHSPRLSACMN